MQSARVGKRGPVVVPAKLRKRLGIEEGSIVIAEEADGGILIPPAIVVPSNDTLQNVRPNSCCSTLSTRPITARPEERFGSWASIPIRLRTGDRPKSTGCCSMPTLSSPLPTDPMQDCFGSGSSKMSQCVLPAMPWRKRGSTCPTKEQQARLSTFSELISRFEAGSGVLPRGISLPGKEAPILLAAIAANATHLLTGDVRHFGPHFGKKIEGTTIVPPGNYLQRRARER